jgi:hypothetical protein
VDRGVRRGRTTPTGAKAVALLSLLATLAVAIGSGAAVLVPVGSTWRYLDDGSDPGAGWVDPLFDDTGWATGPAQLGYGDGDESTVVGYGPDPSDKYVTTYFRHHFGVSDPSSIGSLVLAVQRDDGVVAYLNGTETFRSNMPAGPIGSLTYASAAVGGTDESDFQEQGIPTALLVAGDNVLAVEVHQASSTSSDISFDLELEADASALERAPSLHNATTSSVVVRWRTAVPTESHVAYGPAPGSLTSSVTSAQPTTEHEVGISGLVSATRYYYSVGTTAVTHAGDDPDHYFETQPTPGTRPPVRVWVIGDSGACATSAQGCTNAGDVRDAYFDFVGSELADVWLLLGDNAYSTGTDAQYTAGFFDVYPAVMRNTVVWPAPGNHEFGASDSPTQAGPYYGSFTMPVLGEAGGVPSFTEAYYSFDHANVHFVSLDSHDTSRAAPANPETDVCAPGEGGAMYQWLCADLAATDKDFVIVYWHHPPYTKGSHDSDDCTVSGDQILCEMRERFLPVLDFHGVDLQLTGHSHSYERSVLVDGHYGPSGECSGGECFVDGGDGDPGGDGPYQKATLAAAPGEGTVYAVVGSSSTLTGGPLNHPVMSISLAELGSMVIDVDGHQLDARFIDDANQVRDHFRIVKGPACSDGVDNDADGLSDLEDPGCEDGNDLSERSPLLPCDDGLDNDGDGFTDFVDGDGDGVSEPPGDPGCRRSTAPREGTQCQDGADNDGGGGTDFDGGDSILGAGNGDPAGPDPNCLGSPWKNWESPPPACGLGFELALLLPLLGLARRA